MKLINRAFTNKLDDKEIDPVTKPGTETEVGLEAEPEIETEEVHE